MANIPLIYVDQKKAWEPAVETKEKSKVKKEETKQYYQKKDYRERHVTYKSTSKFIKHPMLRRIEPLQMFLQPSCLYMDKKLHNSLQYDVSKA